MKKWRCRNSGASTYCWAREERGGRRQQAPWRGERTPVRYHPPCQAQRHHEKGPRATREGNECTARCPATSRKTCSKNKRCFTTLVVPLHAAAPPGLPRLPPAAPHPQVMVETIAGQREGGRRRRRSERRGPRRGRWRRARQGK